MEKPAMWFQLLSPWLMAAAMVSQANGGPTADTSALPELIPWRRTEFDIPFVVDRSNDPAWQPVQAELYFSDDHGAHWRLYDRVAVEQRYFKVRARGDGEYWFAMRMSDRAGQARPATINAPGKRILVDTKPPVVKVTGQPGKDGQVAIRWEIEEPNLNAKSLNIVCRSSPADPWVAVIIDRDGIRSSGFSQRGEAAFWPKPGSNELMIRAEVADTAGNSTVATAQAKLDGRVNPAGPLDASNGQRPNGASDAGPALEANPNRSVGVSGNPAIGRKFTPGESSDAGPTLPTPPPPERPRMVNSRTFELEYDIDSVGPSGIGRVELWGTRDGGKTWRSFGVDTDKRSPMPVSVNEEGVYGFRVMVANGVGLGGKPPVAGDPPDLTIGVDLTKPTARIVSAKQGVDAEAGQFVISWQADDQMLAARPVSLLFSENRGGPWLPIAAGLENTGRYAWPMDNRTPGRIYLRLEVRDEAGNVGWDESSEPLIIDQSHPTIRIRSIRPLGQPMGPVVKKQ
jgi:hypothetical protein